jgi:hypothetical protein
MSADSPRTHYGTCVSRPLMLFSALGVQMLVGDFVQVLGLDWNQLS